MRKFTTPTLNITIKKKDGSVASDLTFDYLLFTIKTSGKRVDKRVEYSEVTDGRFSVRFTQEETGAFGNVQAQAEINFFSGSTRVATIIKTMRLDEN